MRTILIIDPDAQFPLKLKGLLKSGFDDLSFESIADRNLQTEYLQTRQPGIVVASFLFPRESDECLNLLSVVREYSSSSIVIVISERITETRFAIKCIKAGAYDVIVKKDYRQLLASMTDAIHMTRTVNDRPGTVSALDGSIETISYPFVITTETGEIKRANQAFKTLSGKEWPEIVNKKLSTLFPAAQISPASIYAKQLGDLHQNTSFCIVNEHWFKIITEPIPFYRKKSPEFSNIFEDITGLLDLERLLRESERRYHGFFNTMAMGILFIDSNFTIKDINPVACQILGIDRKEALFQTLDTLQLTSIKNHIATSLYGSEEKAVRGKVCRATRIDTNDEVILSVTVQPILDENMRTPLYFFILFEDISELTKTKEELIASEIRYHQLLDFVPVGIILLTAGVVKYCNKRAANILNFPSSEAMLDMTVAEMAGADDELENAFAAITSVSDGNTENPLQVQIRRNEHQVDVELNSSRVAYANEQAKIIVLHDISDRVAKDRIRQANEEQLRALYQSAPITIMVVDTNFHIRDINSLGNGSNKENTEKQTPCESASINCAIVTRESSVHDSKRQCYQCNLRSAILGTIHTGLEIHNREITIPRASNDGIKKSTYLLHATRIQQNDEPLCLVVLNDISEIKKTQDELTKAVSALKLAQERNRKHSRWINALYSISRAISRSTDVHSMISISLAFLEKQFRFKCACVAFPEKDSKINVIQGVSHRGMDINTNLGVVPGARFDTTLFPDFFSVSVPGRVDTFSIFDDTLTGIEYWDAFKLRLLQEGLTFSVKVPFAMDQGKNGLLIMEYDETIKLTRDAKYFLADLADIIGLTLSNFRLFTELEDSYLKLEQAIKNLEKQRRMEAMGQIASGITHDINNTLVPIKLYLDSLLEREEGLSEKGRRYLTLIKKSADDIESVTSRLRSFYKKADSTELEPVSLQSVCHDIYDMTKPRWKDSANKKGIDIRFEIDLEDDLPPISANTSELREAFINMVFNAVDAMPSGGTITLTGRKDADRVCVTLSDTGTGMTSETLERCMEPFFTTKGPGGTGLGLAAVYGSVKRFGGEISIQSELGKGTTIVISLPKYSALRQEKKTFDTAVVSNARILLVDDDPRVLDVVKEMLLLDGHATFAFQSAKEALAAYDHGTIQKPDLVITDLGMPEMDGATFAQELKARNHDIPILLMTGWGKLPGKEEHSPFIDKIVSKPINLDTMRGSIVELLSNTKTTGEYHERKDSDNR